MLPDLIEIVPLSNPVRAEITVPGSKSITNRALILAAQAEGETTLKGALWSEDTQVMVACLQELGFMVNVASEPDELCNRTITVYGKGGDVPPGGTIQHPLDLFVANAGTAARFLTAFVCLGKGVYRIHGVARMHERPQAALFQALRELGYRVESPNDRLPAVVHGAGPRAGRCQVSIAESSQFASALLLVAKSGGWKVEVHNQNDEEAPYVKMTERIIQEFPWQGGKFQVEPDASSGSYFLGAGWLMGRERLGKGSPKSEGETGKEACSRESSANRPDGICVARWPQSGLQIDAEFARLVFAKSKGASGQEWTVDLPIQISREADLGDSIMIAAVLASFSKHPVRLTDLGRLRVQETERVAALRTELTRCGARVMEEGDTLTVSPSAGELHGAEIETYNDHRMAMSFAILGLKVAGIKIKDPACVKKTFPNFFQKLADAAPNGLGAMILDGHTRRRLESNELFAD